MLWCAKFYKFQVYMGLPKKLIIWFAMKQQFFTFHSVLIVDRWSGCFPFFSESLMPWRKSGNRVRLRRRQVKSPDRRASDKEQFSLSLPIIRLCREMLQWGRASAKVVDCPTQLTLGTWIFQLCSMTNTSEKYERTQQGNLPLIPYI